MSLTETETCMRLITPALEAAGWDIQTQIRREYTFTAGRIHVRGRLTHRGTPARADYVLFRGDIALAVLEAKKHGLGPANGIQQALRYALETSLVRAKTTREQFAAPISHALAGGLAEGV